MNIKSTLVGTLLAAAASSGFALTTYNDRASFTYLASGALKPLGFARIDGFPRIDSVEPPTLAVAAADLLATPLANGYTPGISPANFLDNWKFDGLAAGTYQFDTTLTTFGAFAIQSVTLGWISGGEAYFAPLTVAGDFLSATGVTTISVDPGCDVKTCVWLNIYGWEDAATTGRGYNATITQVPEPEAWALMLAGMAAIGVVLRRRKAA